MTKNLIPSELQHLNVDKRGFPIPYGVTIDKSGCPHFKVLDIKKIEFCLDKRICHICGKMLLNSDLWLVGGPVSTFHPEGVFAEGPVHKICGIFALQTCPYMVYSRYDAKGIINTEAFTSNREVMFVHNPTQTQDRVPFFVLSRISGYNVLKRSRLEFRIKPSRPYLEIEYWHDGNQIEQITVDKILLDSNMENLTKNGLE